MRNKTNNRQEIAWRVKAGLLISLIACLGTSLAMTAKDHEELLSDAAGAATRDVPTRDIAGDAVQTPEVRFDLAAIKRHKPRNIRTTGLFATRSWYVPPPAPAYTPPPPSQPAAPPLQFIFIGRMVDGNEVTLFLSKNGRQYAVKEKDVLEGVYQVGKIGESDAVLTYLPTNTQQAFLFSSTRAANTFSPLESRSETRPGIPAQQPTPIN